MKIPRRPVHSSIGKVDLPKEPRPAALKRDVKSRKKLDIHDKSHRQYMKKISKKKKTADAKRCRHVETGHQTSDEKEIMSKYESNCGYLKFFLLC